MEIPKLLQYLPPFHGGLEAWALLSLRLIWGTTLAFYGLPMLKNPLHWMEMGDSPAFPGPLQAIGALTIFGGGIAIIAGFLTPLAAFGLTCAMAVALSIHLANGVPFMKPPDAPGVSYEASLVYLGIAILFMFVGPGSLSLDSLLFTYFFD